MLRPSPAITVSSAGSITRLLTLAIEHSAAMRGSFAPDRIELIPVDGLGQCDLDALRHLLGHAGEAPQTLVCVQAANSETGVLQDIAAVSAIVRACGAKLVSDATAAVGKISLDQLAHHVDAVVISAHKFGGPKGAGALILTSDTLQIAEPLLKGGGQEMRRRSGTENVAAIAAMGAAIAEAVQDQPAYARRTSDLRARLEAELAQLREGLVVFGAGAPRLPNTTCLAWPGLKAETLLIALDLAGVAVSSGAACSSGKVARSHVLDAMGVSTEIADGALRLSLGWNSTEEDVEWAVGAFRKVLGALQNRVAA